MSVNLFDANFYRAANSDLASFNDAQALSHFQTYGLSEGRRFSSLVDLSFYKSSNADLASFSNRQAYDHLSNNGVREGRRFSQFFDISFYKSTNSDLAGLNNEQLFDHARNFGVNEGRSFSQFFNISYYAAENPDLVTAGLRGGRLLQHFEINGLNEGRKFSVAFNLDDYRTFNSDLQAANLSSQQLFNHFQLNGLTEGRASSTFFNVSYYLANNSDLRAAGFNNQRAFNHFVAYGQSEGRLGSERSLLSGREISPELNLRGGSQTINGSLSSGDRANNLRSGSYSDDYILTGIQVGQRITINLDAANNSFDTYLQLVNGTTGQLIDYNDDFGSGLNSQLTFTVQAGINYIARATSFNSNAIGNYTITGVAQSTLAGSISGNGSISGSLSSTDYSNPSRTGAYRDDYRVTGVSAGQQIRANLNSSSFDTYLQLVNATTGEVLSYNDDANGTLNSELSFTVQSGIDYIVRATSYGSNITGSYTLTTASSSASIGANQAVSGSLDSTDPTNPLRTGSYRDDYQLTGATTGQQIRVNLNSSAFDTYLSVLANGSELAFNDDSNGTLNSELSFTVQSGVTYTIRVSSYASSSTGAYNLVTTPISAADWFSTNITDAGLQTIVRNRANDGVLDRNDMLAIFRDSGLTDGGTIDSTEQANLRTLISNATRFRMPDYVQFLSQRVVDGISTNMSASQFDSSLVGRWFLGTMAPQPVFNSISNGVTYNLTYSQVQGTLYGSSGRPQIGDIDQGSYGDCAFLAALGATFAPQSSDAGNQRSSILESSIIDNGDNTYTIRFFDSSTPQWVTVDRRLPTLNGTLFGARASGSNNPNSSSNVLWAPLVERAYAQWREWREGGNGYNLIGNGDHPYRPLSFVTGRSTTQYGAGGSAGSFNSVTFSQIQTALSNGRFVELGRYNQSNTTYIVGGHAYTLTNAYVSNGQQRITVRNPWGVDGRTQQGANDGFIDLSFSEFQSNFDSIAFA